MACSSTPRWPLASRTPPYRSAAWSTATWAYGSPPTATRHSPEHRVLPARCGNPVLLGAPPGPGAGRQPAAEATTARKSTPAGSRCEWTICSGPNRIVWSVQSAAGQAVVPVAVGQGQRERQTNCSSTSRTASITRAPALAAVGELEHGGRGHAGLRGLAPVPRAGARLRPQVSGTRARATKVDVPDPHLGVFDQDGLAGRGSPKNIVALGKGQSLLHGETAQSAGDPDQHRTVWIDDLAAETQIPPSDLLTMEMQASDTAGRLTADGKLAVTVGSGHAAELKRGKLTRAGPRRQRQSGVDLVDGAWPCRPRVTPRPRCRWPSWRPRRRQARSRSS